ncbi:hypothetical protein [Azospirillum sp. sgz302134]
MTPEKEALLTAKIDLLIDLVREQRTTLSDHGRRIDSLNDRMDAMNNRMDVMGKSLSDRIDSLSDRMDAMGKSLNDRIDSMGNRIGSLAEDLAYVRVRMDNLPDPAEFYELRGRVEEISRRLPTSIAYAPPAPRDKPAE